MKRDQARSRGEAGGTNEGWDEALAAMPFVRAIRGRVGDRVFKTYGRKIVVTRVPSFAGYVPTAAQRERRALMREATRYAQAVYADPAAKAVYVAAAQRLGRRAFRLAVSDWLVAARAEERALRRREMAAVERVWRWAQEGKVRCGRREMIARAVGAPRL